MQRTKNIFFQWWPSLKNLQHAEEIILRNKIYSYLFTITLSSISVAVTIYLYTSVGRFNVMPIFFLAIILSTWYGSFRTGIIAILITSISYIYHFVPLLINSGNGFMTLISPILLIVTGLVSSYLLDKAKRTDEVEKYKLEKLKESHLLTLEKKKNIQAHEEIKARDEFLSIASHELKTPLTLSLLQIQRALHNIKNVSLANFSVQNLMNMLESIEHQTDRLSKLISDLSNVSLITTGRMRLEVDEVDLTEIIKDVMKRVPLTMNKENYPVIFKENGEVKGQWDKIRIEQVLTNLFTNAIKYGNDKPIEVGTYRIDGWAILFIRDRGMGIAKDIQKRVFDRFERGSVGGIEGLGVGLYITKQIVNAHGGTIELKSKPGRGSEFIVKLPRKTEEEAKKTSQ